MKRYIVLFTVLLCSISAQSQCLPKVVSVKFYHAPLFLLYWSGRTTQDIIELSAKNDSMFYMRVISDSLSLTEIDGLLNSSKAITGIYCSKKGKPKKYSFDVRQVFKLEFIDGRIIYICLSSVRSLMMIDEKVYEKDQILIPNLYKVLGRQNQ